MRITNIHVTNLAGACVASGLPLQASYSPEKAAKVEATLQKWMDSNGLLGLWNEWRSQQKSRDGEEQPPLLPFQSDPYLLPAVKAFDRMVNLSSCEAGTGHDNALSGIQVVMDITATNVWWLQFGRYHFQQIVSSQSKMHCLEKLVLSGESPYEAFHPSTPKAAVDAFMEQLKPVEGGDRKWNENTLYACPMGLLLTAQVVTNYRQLKTIFQQRRHHRLREWWEFCAEVRRLPYADLLITRRYLEMPDGA